MTLPDDAEVRRWIDVLREMFPGAYIHIAWCRSGLLRWGELEVSEQITAMVGDTHVIDTTFDGIVEQYRILSQVGALRRTYQTE